MFCTPLVPDDVPDTTPVVGIVSRFATQKGFDLIAQVATRSGRRRSVYRRAGYRRTVLRKPYERSADSVTPTSFQSR